VKVHCDFPHTAPVGADYPVLTLGVFDGVHLGHRRILERLLAVAAGRPAAVVTFDPHPRAVLGPPKAHRLLSPIDERLDLLAEWPLAATVVLRFDASVARLSYVEFVRDCLVGQLGARHLVLGFDTRLGHDRGGTPERLIDLGHEAGYEVERVDAVRVGDEVVSSTAVRHLLDAGEVEPAARLLGRPYGLRGEVVRGAGRGRGLGIPTANLAIAAGKLVPADGVYAARVRARGRDWAGAVNIGGAPTFAGPGGRTVEVHLVGFDGDLYGDRVELWLLRRLREERRFQDVEALVTQVRADIESARRVVAEDAPGFGAAASGGTPGAPPGQSTPSNS
jgi:riboflavin kinase/FMN adenylyltransferase